MFGKKCTSCEAKVGGLFGMKNAGTKERPLCNNCFEEEIASEKVERKQHEAEPQLSKCNTYNASGISDADSVCRHLLKAVEAIPTNSVEFIQKEYEGLIDGWLCRELYVGTREHVLSLAKINIEQYVSRSEFQGFSVDVYNDQRCAQATAFFKGGPVGIYGLGIRIWKSDDRMYIAGGDDFLDIKEEVTMEQLEKEQTVKEQRANKHIEILKGAECEPLTDIDGNIYQTIKIGKQVWTVENLKTTKYNDGTAIPLVSDIATWASYDDNKKPGYCWYDDDKSENEKYGALYNWYAVSTGKLAPKGWHVPTDSEWTELEEYLIANGYNWDGTKVGNKIAKALAAKTDWDEWLDMDPGTPGNDLSKNNASGFSALPGGSRMSYNGFDDIDCDFDDDFDHLGCYGHWWSAAEGDAYNACIRTLFWRSERLIREDGSGLKGSGFSVRLLRD